MMPGTDCRKQIRLPFEKPDPTARGPSTVGYISIGKLGKSVGMNAVNIACFCCAGGDQR